jgi:hypothetical protein|tara:strand:- start:664 stop:885 length:222 start_codon:yes stop_codon:yes gene_type:complete
MATRKFKKTAKGDMLWQTMASDVKVRAKQDWCAFYTPMGRMVSKPQGKRPSNIHPEDWCAEKTPFRGKVRRSY